jgi:predicted membrane protein
MGDVFVFLPFFCFFFSLVFYIYTRNLSRFFYVFLLFFFFFFCVYLGTWFILHHLFIKHFEYPFSINQSPSQHDLDMQRSRQEGEREKEKKVKGKV